MNNTISLIIEPTDGYINSFTRNTVKGWWEAEIGLPSNWVFDENDDIKCEIILENDIGKLIKLIPTNDAVLFDDLVAFVEIIIETNRKIVEKEKEFTDKMVEMKNILEIEAKKFYKELDEMRENSFKHLSTNLSKKNVDNEKVVKKVRAKAKAISELTDLENKEISKEE